MASKGQKFRKWSVEEKLLIVKRHLDEHLSVRDIQEQEQVHHSLVSAWVRQYADEGEKGLEFKRKGNPYAALHASKSLTEVERLQLIIAKQEIELERLKKGYYVEGAGVNRVFVTSKDANTKSSKS